jgi:hypothetical protein
MASGWHRKADTPAARARVTQYRSPEHRAKVKEYKALQADGLASCWRCGRWLGPGMEMHAGHDDHDRTVYRGPECGTCSRNTAARRGNRVSNANRRRQRERQIPPPRPQSRNWG